ncbi:MAG: T9SS type A sorting domain-containing protein [Ferruginibacter sp.]|nr:T9SS type A sorting domain-containing protein [Ferruginibacter sp.]
MKQLLLGLTFILSCIIINAQTISLGTDNEYCPNVEYEFTVTLPGAYSSISATQMLITQAPYAFNSSYTSFKFKAKFNDVNIKQFVNIGYNSNNDHFKPEFKRVKSLFFTNNTSCGLIQPKFTSNNAPATIFNAPLCQINSFNITFNKVKWYTEFEYPVFCFGSISDYEYLLPAGWKLGNATSNGTAWLQGTNTVTITSDLSTAHGSTIQIRPKNTCVTPSANGQIPVAIFINRQNSFTISPGNKTIPCGSTTPVTFTINNVFSATGITDYTWNLGTTPNGWLLPNGNPAPSVYSTGNNNTLTLTPACGAVPGNVGATVTVNGISCTATPSNVSVGQAALSISGNSNFCTTATYTIDNLPCNSTNVVWELIPSWAGTITVSNNQATITPVTNVNNNVTLKASVTSSCFTNTVQVERQIAFGVPAHTIDVLDGAMPLPEEDILMNTSYSLGATETEGPYLDAGTASYIWQLNFTDPYGGSTWYNLGTHGYGYTPPIIFDEYGQYQITVDIVNNSCQYHGRYFTRQITFQNPYGRFSVSPNPTTGIIRIQPPVNNTVKSKEKAIEIRKIELIDKMGIVKYQQNFASGLTSTKISVNHLPNDVYTLRIFDGQKWHTHKIVVQH